MMHLGGRRTRDQGLLQVARDEAHVMVNRISNERGYELLALAVTCARSFLHDLGFLMLRSDKVLDVFHALVNDHVDDLIILHDAQVGLL